MSQSKIGELVMLGERVTGVVMLDDKAYDLSAIKQLLSNQIPEGHIAVPIDDWEVLCERERERDALAAQVEASNKVLESLLKTPLGLGGSLQADGQFYYKVAESVFEKAKAALSKNPQQCLLDIKVEASRKGFLAGAFWEGNQLITGVEHDCELAAGEYAESVRNGGE